MSSSDQKNMDSIKNVKSIDDINFNELELKREKTPKDMIDKVFFSVKTIWLTIG